MAKWGLIPFWTKPEALGKQAYNTINERAETIQTAASYREPFKQRRCLVPATGWYEWQKLDAKKKRPIYMCPEASPFALAGVYDTWTGKNGEANTSFAIVTTDAAPMLVALGRIRDTLVSSLISIPPSILLIAAAAPHGITAVAMVTLVTEPLQAFVAVSFVRRHVCLAWAEILRAAAPGAVATLGAAAGIVAVMSLVGFRTALSFGEMLVAILATGLGWLAGLWLGGHEPIGGLRRLWIQVRRWT